MSRRRLRLLLGAAALGAAIIVVPKPRDGDIVAPTQAASPTAAERRAPPMRPVPDREGGAVGSASRDTSEPGNLFAGQAPAAVLRPAPKPAPPRMPEPPIPVPALPYRYLGLYSEAGTSSVFILVNDRGVAIKPGDIIDGTFRVAGIEPGYIAFVHLPSNQELRLATNEVAR